MNNDIKINIDQHIELFMQHCNKKLDNNYLAKGTLTNYKILTNMLTGCQNIDDLIERINRILRNDKYTNATKRFYKTVFTLFLKFISDKNKVFIDLTDLYKVESPQITRRAYTDEELKILFEQLELFGNDNFTFWFKFLLFTGIRCAEIDIIDFKVFVKNGFKIYFKALKHNNTRIASLDEDNIEMREMLSNGTVKILKSKTIKNCFALFRKFVFQNVPNFTNGIHAHLLRHTFITWSVNKYKADINIVSKLSGHKSVSTTQRYVSDDLNIMGDNMENIQKSLFADVAKLKTTIDDNPPYLKMIKQTWERTKLSRKA
ncbi:tyrosine-type recombinase/integrase [Mycoplasma simbae]|uniref:tyrosine-type recombinase/integrase n=1 Tax=Mycoplasma simbae TaxID=36744 RepID=UPI000496F666|nr:tyrosine-type recombinase/integrase [Mycoplasma simbae]